MDKLNKAIIAVGIILALTTALYLYFFIPQYNFLSKEIQAIKMSSPIPINRVLVFGNGMYIFHLISYQEQAYFYDNLSNYEIEYNGIYFPISATIGDILQNSVSTNTNLIGEKVYLSFIITKNSSSAPYIINKIYTKGNMFYWILGQDTGISNSSAVLWTKNSTTLENSASQLNGIEFLNKTGFISPANPAIYDLLHKGFTALYFPLTYLFEIDLGIASIFIILIAIKIKRKIKK